MYVRRLANLQCCQFHKGIKWSKLGILAIKSFFRYLTTLVFTSDNRRYNTGLFFHKFLQWSNNVCWIKNSVANLKAIFQLKIRNLLIVKIKKYVSKILFVLHPTSAFILNLFENCFSLNPLF